MVFSLSIYQDRVAKARKVAVSRGLAGLILTRPSSIFYAAKFVHASTPERPLYAVVPVDGEPLLLAPAIEYGHAKSKTWFKDVRRWYFDLPSREQPFKSLAKMLEEKGMAGKAIGVEDSGAIAALQKEMPGTKFVNTVDIIRDLRMIKSKEELDLMKSRSAYADFALETVKESVREGVTELEIVGKAVHETLSKMSREIEETDGAMPINVRVVGGMRTAFPHAFSTTRKLKKGDVVLAFASSSAYGYEGGEIARTLFFGKPTEEQKKIYNTALQGMNLTMNAMKPGAICSDIYKINHDHLTNSGYGEYAPAKPGALRGLESRDGIYIGELDQTVLKPTMTFWVGSGICIPGNGGYRLGNLVLVTDKGSESMHRFPSDLESMIIGT